MLLMVLGPLLNLVVSIHEAAPIVAASISKVSQIMGLSDTALDSDFFVIDHFFAVLFSSSLLS
jgi:hypothetical protein